MHIYDNASVNTVPNASRPYAVAEEEQRWSKRNRTKYLLLGLLLAATVITLMVSSVGLSVVINIQSDVMTLEKEIETLQTGIEAVQDALEIDISSTTVGAAEGTPSTTQSAISGGARLVDDISTSKPGQGRVEILYNGEWGTICDSFWNIPDSTVICRMLGYAYVNCAQGGGATLQDYGIGKGKIWLSQVECLGHESDIGLCKSNGWGNITCDHTMDVGACCS